MNMKENNCKFCICEECARYKRMEVSETALHAFLGLSEPNIDCERDDFETNLEYTNILYWDVSQCGVERYCIYRNDAGVLVAWYDRVNQVGFKRFFENEISSNTRSSKIKGNIR